LTIAVVVAVFACPEGESSHPGESWTKVSHFSGEIKLELSVPPTSCALSFNFEAFKVSPFCLKKNRD
jgi:hypothetical protein